MRDLPQDHDRAPLLGNAPQATDEKRNVAERIGDEEQQDRSGHKTVLHAPVLL